MRKAFTLMYHDVVPREHFHESGMQGAAADVYKLDVGEFRLHLDAIHQTGSARVRTCLDQDADDSPIYLTFDDGGACSPWIAGELERRGWRGHFFITTDWIGKPGFVAAAELREMASRGHLIGSHSCSHPPRISALSTAEILREWRESVAILSELVSKPVTIASVPGGFYSRQVAELAAEAGIGILFTSEPTATPRHYGPNLVLGRYYLQRGMSAEKAASFAGGPGTARLQQAVGWKLRQAAKKVGWEWYAKFRGNYLGRRQR